MIRDVTDLEVYRLSLNLIPRVYSLVRKLPKSENDIGGQIKRSAKSVPPNIAEGFAKRSSDKEFKRFLKIAIASSDETISHLRTMAIVCPRLLDEAKKLGGDYKILSKRINKLQSVWRSDECF